MNQPDGSSADHHGAVDLDFVEDPDLGPEERDLDARLARLVSSCLHAEVAPASRVDVAALARAAAVSEAAPRRRRTGWVVTALAAAAAVVAAAAGVSTGVLPAPVAGPWSTDTTTTAVHLRDGVPELPADETTHLTAMREEEAWNSGDWAVGPIGSWTTPLDCTKWWDWDVDAHGAEPAVLDGIDTADLRQVCAATTARTDGAPLAVYRFYVPEGVDLDFLTLDNATDAGVSYTAALLGGPDAIIEPDDRSADLGGTRTYVTWLDERAQVYRSGDHRTDIAWVDPLGKSSTTGSGPVVMHAVVAAEPVTAVRAAVGFRNQGEMQVVPGDDGALLLVQASPPRVWFQAALTGSVTRSREGCLGVASGPGDFQLVMWPYGTVWDAAAQTLTIPGEGRYRLGEQVRLGGGYGPGTIAQRLVPAGCVKNGLFG